MTKSKPVGGNSSERKHRAILEAAEELFLRQGFLGTSMDEIASLAGVSKQTVYARFSSKEALFVAMCGGMTSAAAATIETGMGEWHGGTTLAEYLIAYALRQLEVTQTDATAPAGDRRVTLPSLARRSTMAAGAP